MSSLFQNLPSVGKDAVDEAKRVGEVIIMCIDSFQTDEEALMLRDLLWYAKQERVPVEFVAENTKKKGKLIS